MVIKLDGDMLDRNAVQKIITLTRFEIHRAINVPEKNIDVRVDYLIEWLSYDMIATVRGLVDERPEEREEHDYINSWQRFKAEHLPTLTRWGIFRRPKMYRLKIVIRVCPHLEVKDDFKHIEFVTWED